MEPLGFILNRFFTLLFVLNVPACVAMLRQPVTAAALLSDGAQLDVAAPIAPHTAQRLNSPGHLSTAFGAMTALVAQCNSVCMTAMAEHGVTAVGSLDLAHKTVVAGRDASEKG
jgi:hypothetical protein